MRHVLSNEEFGEIPENLKVEIVSSSISKDKVKLIVKNMKID